jgi:hypothetical protein
MKARLLAIAWLIGLVSLSTSGNAATITYSFTGTWDESFDFVGGLGTISAPAVGDPFSGFVTIDAAQIGIVHAGLCCTVDYPGMSLSITTAGHTYSTSSVNVQATASPTNGQWTAEPNNSRWRRWVGRN